MKKKFIAFVNHRYVQTFGIACGAETLPEVDNDFCNPEVALSEIQRVFFRKIGSQNFNDWTQAAEWTERMSETSMDIDAIRPLTGIGDKPAPAETTKEISAGRKFTTRKEHTINFTIDEVTDANHAFLQYIENGKRYIMNYETAGGYMFGGNNGIVVEVRGAMILPRGGGEIMTYQLTITWVSGETEARCLSPIFGQTVFGSDALDTTILFATDATPARGDCDFVLAGGTNAVAQFQYNDINPTIGDDIVMTIKVGGVLKLTCNMKADFLDMPFIFKDAGGVSHSGFIAAGDVTF